MNALDILSGADEPVKPLTRAADNIAALDAQRAVHQANLDIALDARADAEAEITATGVTAADVSQLDREIDGLSRAIEANRRARQRAQQFDQEAHFLAERAQRQRHWKRYQELTAEQVRSADKLDKAFAGLDKALAEFLALADERETNLVQAMRGIVRLDAQGNARSYLGRRVIEILLRSSLLADESNRRLFGGMVKMLPLAPKNTTRAAEMVAADAERIDSWIGKTIAEAVE